jgi:hypothetical protein
MRFPPMKVPLSKALFPRGSVASLRGVLLLLGLVGVLGPDRPARSPAKEHGKPGSAPGG